MSHSFQLDLFQQEAIDYTRQNHSVIVSAPTGAGKTVIAEDVIEECIRKNTGVIYTAPIKALSNQKYRDFCKKYPNITGILTGDVSINRDAPILIMTTEIFRNAILVDSEFLKSREWIIFDEIHYLDDPERGTVWEESIMLLPPHMKMLALSATLPNLQEFAGWLAKVHAFPIKVIEEGTRPVPLHFLFQCNNEFFSSLKELKHSRLLPKETREFRRRDDRFYQIKNNRISTLIEYLQAKRATPCVYFSFSRKRTEDLADEARSFNFLEHDECTEITRMFEDLVNRFNISDSPHIDSLYPLIKKGIAYHHAGLLPTLKEIIERLFTTGLIKMIFTTETFALGINMPAKMVVFDSLSKFYDGNLSYLRTRDFYQMAGRAGRRGMDTEGFVMSRVNPMHIDAYSLERIIYGHFEPIRSQFNSCYATILNMYKIMQDKIYEIYPNSFHFYQSQAYEKKEVQGLLRRKIAMLREMRYINGYELTPKAELAARVYSFELQIAELFAQGFFDSLDPETLFIVICALVYEPRRNEVKPDLTKRIKQLRRQLDDFMKDIHKQEKSFRIWPQSKRFHFNLNEAASRWFKGEDFSALSECCFVDEGEIVRYFRMAIQVLREIKACDMVSPTLKTNINTVLDRINRDAIDAEKQLRQEI